MKGICVDASLAIKMVIAEQYTKETERLFFDCATKETTIIAPSLIIYEMESVVRRYVYTKKITEQAGDKAFSMIDVLPLEIQSHPMMHRKARELAKKFNQVRVYDSTYAALAELHGCEFWTGDERFYNSVMEKLHFVHLIRDYN